MGKRLVICRGFGAWYPDGVQRCQESFSAPGVVNRTSGIRGEFHKDSKVDSDLHRLASHSFKFHAIQNARREGFTSILWVDASTVFVKDPTPLFERMEQSEHGCLLVQDDHNHGEYVNETALRIFCSMKMRTHWHDAPYGREVALSGAVPNVWACVMGFDLTKPCATTLVERAVNLSVLNPNPFNGPDNNDDHAASFHPRVRGHRHDQTVVEYLAWRAGVKPIHHTDMPIVTANKVVRDNFYLYAEGM